MTFSLSSPSGLQCLLQGLGLHCGYTLLPDSHWRRTQAALALPHLLVPFQSLGLLSEGVRVIRLGLGLGFSSTILFCDLFLLLLKVGP